MITFLEGVLEEKQPGRAVVNVGGVGYEVLVPLGSFERLPPPGARTRLLIHHHITEAAQALFGFASDEERRLFVLLLGVGGIGPKTALSALSGLSVRELQAAVAGGDIKRLSSISGIGRKTAERIVVELRDKFPDGGALEPAGEPATPGDRRLRDAELALTALGYKADEARGMIRRLGAGPEASVETLIRMALTGK